MGNTIQILTPSTTYIAEKSGWIEGNALLQLQNVEQLAGMKRIVGMPDLHAGRGYPVGAAFFSTGRFYPALIGNDIGCGMSFWQTELKHHALKLDKVERALRRFTDQATEEWLQDHVPQTWRSHQYASSLGSIGSGNHFAELQKVVEIFSPDFAEYGLDAKRVYLLAHSGSRGLGQAILSTHIRQFNHDGLTEGSIEAQHYLKQHHEALDYARLNRSLIGERILGLLRLQAIHHHFDYHHNFMEEISLSGEIGWLHRKGASPCNGGLSIIPGSRGDYSYLVKTIENPSLLSSMAHGAGRKWMRTECQGRLVKNFSVHSLTRTALGSRVICDNKALLYEEAPEAYKPIEEIITALVKAGVISVVAKLAPIITLKTTGGHRCD